MFGIVDRREPEPPLHSYRDEDRLAERVFPNASLECSSEGVACKALAAVTLLHIVDCLVADTLLAAEGGTVRAGPAFLSFVSAITEYSDLDKVTSEDRRNCMLDWSDRALLRDTVEPIVHTVVVADSLRTAVGVVGDAGTALADHTASAAEADCREVVDRAVERVDREVVGLDHSTGLDMGRRDDRPLRFTDLISPTVA